MAIISFSNLHAHSFYSLLDGFNSPTELVEKAKELGHPALAITDHGSIHGYLELYKAAKKNNVKPIIGVEMYITSAFADDGLKKDLERYHLIVLAKNEKGLKNLFKLVTLSNTEGFYYKPRITFEWLKKYSKGLIISSACMQGEVAKNITNNNIDQAKEVAKEYKKVFKDDYYLEIMANNIKEQFIINAKMVEIGRELDIKLIATNDIHYLEKEDAEAQDVMLAINTGKDLSDPDRFSFDGNEYYFKDKEEIIEGLFTSDNREIAEQALENTQEIVDKVEDYNIETGHILFPPFNIESKDNSNPEEFLRKLSYQKLFELSLKKDIDVRKYRNRIEEELKVINMKGFPKYFLVVSEMIDWAKKNDILVGPSRGSAGGSLISYLLNITAIDPIKYDLLFSRFLNPERESPPDIDIDMEKSVKDNQGRDKLIQHTIDKYGRDRVANICTFGTMATKGSLKDVGRTLGIDFYTMNNKIVKAVPDDAKNIEDALEKSDELKGYEQQYPKLFKYAKAIEGKPKNLGTHASAIAVTPDPVTNYTPLARTKNAKGDVNYVTQTEMHDSEELGLLKIDFLGLETLNIIKKTVKAINKHTDFIDNINDIWTEIDLNDEDVYKNIYQKADNNGVFQVESYLFSDLLKRMRPSEFKHIVALVALGRPGPMEAGLVDKYIKRMHGREEVDCYDDSLIEVLEPTYGLPIYQESVMAISRKVGGFSLGRGDVLRRAMGKKKMEVMEKLREEFINGSIEKGFTEEFADKMFGIMEKFAGYGFNKSHSVAYGLVSYVTAYLKYHYPVEFYAALMTAETKKSGSDSNFTAYLSDCYQKGINILPPDINESGLGFTAIDSKEIRYGLTSINNVGGKALKGVLETRPFNSFKDFYAKIDKRTVNKRVVENLIKAGAFDRFNTNRNELIDEYYRIRKVNPNQMALFAPEEIKKEAETTEEDIVNMEIEALGTSVTYPSEFDTALDGDIISVTGDIKSKKEITDRNDNLMAFLELKTKANDIKVVVFTNQYVPNHDLFQQGFRVRIKGEKSDDAILLKEVKLYEGDLYKKEAS